MDNPAAVGGCFADGAPGDLSQYAAHNRFLTERLGNADKKSLGRTEYLFEWGSICSYMDIKTGECVIRVEY